jgi:hypothetical protein
MYHSYFPRSQMVFILTKYKQENINIYSTLSVLLDRLMNIFLF